VMNVGKRCGAKKITQDEINALMVETARLGFAVVRLKSGDPAIFGRLAEELDALDAAQIPYEVVPGITAALGAAASLGVSLTDRRTSSRVVIVTAHQSLSPRTPGSQRAHAGTADILPSENWKSLAREDSTLVIYMPGHDFATLRENLLAAGLAADTPAKIVSHASTPRQRDISTTLGELVECALEAGPALAPPTILLIGRAVARAGSDSSGLLSRRSDSPDSSRQSVSKVVASSSHDLEYQLKGNSHNDD